MQWIYPKANLIVNTMCSPFARGKTKLLHLVNGGWAKRLMSKKTWCMCLGLVSDMFIPIRKAKTYKNSASECLSGDHDTGPVFDWSHPSHFIGWRLLLLIRALWCSVGCLIVGGVVHLLSLLEKKRKRNLSRQIKETDRNTLLIISR